MRIRGGARRSRMLRRGRERDGGDVAVTRRLTFFTDGGCVWRLKVIEGTWLEILDNEFDALD